MNVYKVTLFGHRELYEHRKIEEKLTAIFLDLLRERQYVEIYIGRNGEFDIFAASVLKRIRKRVGDSNYGINLVLPYTNKDIEYYEQYYDSVMIYECIGKIHPKGAITKRNRWMVEQCDLFICYVEHKGGGAYTALQYAEKLGKKIINIATDEY
ncbi:MAG: hypothetical protein E7589_05140 [Ruminococcaceae bacterium]|nr:hypothetical protein [Oscillospiraceae bacterium]